jgi:hypothetical protein
MLRALPLEVMVRKSVEFVVEKRNKGVQGLSVSSFPLFD